MRWLYNLPNSCIVLLFGLIGAALFVGVLFLRIKLLRFQIESDHAKAAHDALAVVIGFAALILAFSLVQEQNNVRNLEAQVGTEADNLSQLDRLLIRFGNPGDNALRLSLRGYANSIVNDEWREQSKGGASGRTAKLFREFSEDVSAIDPTPGRQSLIYTEMLKKIDELELAREARLVAADNIRLAPIFWETIAFLILTLLLLAAFSETTFSLGGAMALACQGFAVTLLVALIFIYDRPFKGKATLSPKPIINAIAEMQNRASIGH
jgi:Protein of unknown function (DUF4239)